MIYIFEAFFVGIYCLVLYRILNYKNVNNYYYLFTFDFLKHYLSFYFGIHDYYCNNGYACKNNKLLHLWTFKMPIFSLYNFCIFLLYFS